MFILGIETSCDETAASVVRGDEKGVEILSNVVSSQIQLHSQWGGVVPNLAAREHLKNIIPVVENALENAKVKISDIDLLAVTSGPGLIPALLIGVTAAKTLSYISKKPLLGIQHIEGHIYANFVGDFQNKKIEFPLLCLVVSGGHTELVLMRDHFDYEVVGQTLDDAAGEAFDKVARLLKLGYPGGPVISDKAAHFSASQNRFDIAFPRPMITSPDFDFSFSGLKTSVLYTIKREEKFLTDADFIIAASHEFQQAVIDVLVLKTMKAAKKFQPKTICLAGGVSANKELRKQLGEMIEEKLPGTAYLIPDLKYSVDNAAMIAVAAYFRYQKMKDKELLMDNWKNLEADPSWEL